MRSPGLKIVIFAPVQPDHASRNAMRPYRDRYVYVKGNPLDREELKPLVLKPGLHSVIVFNEFLTSDARADAMDVVVCAANVESMLPPGHSNVLTLVSLNSSSDMRFVDRTSWWPSSEDPIHGHVSSPAFAAGCAIAEEMLYPLMMGWYKHGLIELCSKLTDSVLDPTEVKLIELPAEFHAVPPRRFTYGEMVAPMMSAGYLPIALYRMRTGAAARFMQPYVCTNPAHGTLLRNTDRVYVLTRGRNSRNYTSSVKHLERAARTIQRYYRQRAEEHWAYAYWQRHGSGGAHAGGGDDQGGGGGGGGRDAASAGAFAGPRGAAAPRHWQRVKHLERAARTIQRYYRQRAEEHWAYAYWQRHGSGGAHAGGGDDQGGEAAEVVAMQPRQELSPAREAPPPLGTGGGGGSSSADGRSASVEDMLREQVSDSVSLHIKPMQRRLSNSFDVRAHEEAVAREEDAMGAGMAGGFPPGTVPGAAAQGYWAERRGSGQTPTGAGEWWFPSSPVKRPQRGSRAGNRFDFSSAAPPEI
eukprot:CAMPEP_0206064600 /NCGR_PEP_ID=MMETSP1466-20131121/58812_1 /ASSEMBLY_ACC=CAM_ASM_001126 /TAXON_ID=44452 /ORGANISM="Pavlova gyrans, Strain CCMP608" /LENGTH=526 /DNA_ID=CAMNT_0053439973 /DNA_START=23 /DNA_END=1602 /DNA_ORIENTATION=+